MPEISRRDWIAMAGALAAVAPALSAAEQTPQTRVVSKGRLKQSACRWCYRDIPLPALAKAAAEMGLTALDLVDEGDWPILAEHGLLCSMGWKTSPGGIPDGLNDPRNHDAIVKGLVDAMPRAQKAGVPNLIAFFGNRKGMSDADAIKNCVAGLQRVKKAAEDSGINVCVELLNSKVDHKDYQGDHTAFGVEVVAARPAALRHLPHADHGGRRDPHHPRQPPVDRPLPHGRRARPPRARRHPGAQLADRGAHHRRHRLHGVRGPRVRADTRSAHLAPRGDRALRRVRRLQRATR
jgi:hypothetical protein